WQADRGRPLAEMLVENGSLSERERRAIEHVCETHLAKCGDDPRNSPASCTMAPTVSFRGPPGVGTATTSLNQVAGDHQAPTSGDFGGGYELLGEIAHEVP